jgi:hypothetical protein
MATKAEAFPSEATSFVSDLAGIPSFLIDPEGAARRVRSKWFWIGPVVISLIVAIAVIKYITPYAIHAAVVSGAPDGISTAQYVERVGIGMKFQAYLSPVFVIFFYSIEALLLMAMAAILGASARFGQLFNLAAGCGIIQSLAGIASAVIIHFKGEITSMAELRPAMGLDIFMPEGTNKYLVAFGSTFSVFQIWWFVMMVLIFAVAFKVSKGKAFAAVFPLWVLGLCFSLLGAVFQK